MVSGETYLARLILSFRFGDLAAPELATSFVEYEKQVGALITIVMRLCDENGHQNRIETAEIPMQAGQWFAVEFLRWK